MHPFGRIATGVGIALLVTALLWPIVSYVLPFWPLLALGIGIGIAAWRIPVSQLNQLMQNPLAKGLAIAALLTAVYSAVLYLLYNTAAGKLVVEAGVERRVAWLVVTVLGLPVIPLLWRLYAATNIPGDPVAIGRAFRGLTLFLLVFFAWWSHAAPNRLFDRQTGKPLFWVAEKEGRVYFSGGFSPTTGEELRTGTTADAEKFRRRSWVAESADTAKSVIAWLGGEPTISLCDDTAEGVRAQLSGVVEVPLQPNCWSQSVHLPATVERYRITLTTDGDMLFVRYPDDTSRDLSGDKLLRHVPWSSFRLRGEGTARVILRPLGSTNEVSGAQ